MADTAGSIAESEKFAQKRRWQSFSDASTEQEYRAWYLTQVLAGVRWTGLFTMVLYIAIAPAWEAIAGVDAAFMRLNNWGLVAPTFAVALALTYTRLRIHVGAIASICVLIQSLDLMWFMSTLYGPADGSVMVAAVLGISIPAIGRISTRWTAFIAATITSVQTALLVASVTQGDTSLAETWRYFAFVTAAPPLAIAGAVFNESGMRRQFAAESTVQASQRLLRKYAPAAVAARIESGDAETVGQPQRLRVTALSSDVAGFTALADQIDPESLSQIINEYMATMSDVVENQGGVVTEFAGDGLMAIFGAPEPLEPSEQVQRALSAANAMHTRLAQLSKTWFRLGIEQPLKVRIGINTGMLSVGTFGSDGRATYTAIGLQMNVAARIQAHCEPGSILLSSSSWHLVNDIVDCRPLGEVTVKGVHFPISIYAPRPQST